MKILITGGTGLVGRHLTKMLVEKGYSIFILTRSKKTSNNPKINYSYWDYENNIIDSNIVCNVDYIIHLAGANIADKKWTSKQKQIIIDSRVKTANLIFNTLKNNNHTVKGFISASGSNAYGVKTTNNIFKEQEDFGSDFLATVCKKWEAAAFQFKQLNINTVCLRTGVVFAKKNSALQKMLPPIQIGIGSALGSGKQQMPIIHIEDLCKMYLFAIENNLNGAYNAASYCGNNKSITKTIAKHLNKPFFFPNVPASILKLIFGEMASILLEGSAINNNKIKEAGFMFKHPNLESILVDIL